MIRFKNMHAIPVIVLPVFVPVDSLSLVGMLARPSVMRVMLVLLVMRSSNDDVKEDMKKSMFVVVIRKNQSFVRRSVDECFRVANM